MYTQALIAVENKAAYAQLKAAIENAVGSCADG